MDYSQNRLQFVHHDECFASAEAAKAYVSALDIIERPALFAEPMILKYGDESNPNIIVAIGSVGNGEASTSNKTFFIDSASIEGSIEEIEKELGEQAEAIKELQDNMKAIIAACGLNEDGSYKVHTDDTILKTAKSLDEADALLSAYIQKQELYVEDTKTVDLSLDKADNGQTLSADVKLAEYKAVEKVQLPNIILAEENGLFANVDLTYDEENNDLTFSVNGESKTIDLPEETHVVKGEYDTKTESIILTLNNGDEVKIDVQKLIGEWTVIGEFTDTPIILSLTPVKYEDTLHGADLYQDLLKADVRIADSDTKPFNILKKTEDGRNLYVDGLAKNIKYLKDGEMITVQEGLDSLGCDVSTSNDNILYKRTDGLFTYVDVSYNASTNVLTFKHSTVSGGTATETYTLNSAKLLDDVSYDSSREVLILRFTTADGKTSKVEIPVSDILTEWEVDNSNNTVTLVKTRSVAGTDKLSANVNISSAEYNIVENNGHAIYVRGTADNIRYDEDYTVEGKIKALGTDLTTKVEEETTRAKEAEQTLNSGITTNRDAISAEATRATSAETALQKSIEDAETASQKLVEDETIRATSAETALEEEIKTNTSAITDAQNDIQAVSATAEANKSGLAQEIIDARKAEHDLLDTVKAVSGVLETEVETVNVSYDSATNSLIFTNSKGETTTKQLNSGSIIYRMYYDSAKKELHIEYTTTESKEIKDVVIDVTDLFNQIEVSNPTTNAVELTLVKDSSVGNDILSADVKISDSANNLLVKDNGNLFVSNQANDIKLSNGTSVASAITEAQTSIANEIARAEAKEAELEAEITAGSVKISKTEGNIIVLYEDGIYSKSSQLTYDTGSNTLYFTPADATSATPIVLNSIDTIQDIYFDGETDELVFKYTVGGEEKTVRVKAAAFFKGIVGTSDGNVTVTTALTTSQGSTSTGITANLDVNKIIDNTASTVKLSKNSDNEIVANVNIASSVPHNILQVDGSNSSLFVAGTADNISATYKDKATDVQTVISEISSDITDLQIETAYISGSVKDMLVILNTHTDQIRVLSGDLETEIEERKGADTYLSGIVETCLNEVQILSAKVESYDKIISNLQERMTNLESSVTSGFNAVWEELKRLDRKSTIVDDDENDYIKHTFSVNTDTTSEYSGNTMIHTELSEDLSRDSDDGTETDF